MRRAIVAISLILMCLSLQAQDHDYTYLDWSPLGTNTPGWKLGIGGIAIGCADAVGSPDGMNAKMGKSIELSWLSVIGVRYVTPDLRHRFLLGAGVNWRNYRFEDDTHLGVFSLTVPALYRYKIHGRWGVFAGPVINFNLHAKNAHQTTTTLDLMGGVNFSAVAWYVRYSPCHVLSKGPEFTLFSTGIAFFL